MSNPDPSKNEDHFRALDRDHRNWVLTSFQRLRLFFAALVFAILSYSLQVDFVELPIAAKGFYSAAWVGLLIAGLLALREAGGFVLIDRETSLEGLSPNQRRIMWSSFVVSLVFLGAAKWAS